MALAKEADGEVSRLRSGVADSKAKQENYGRFEWGRKNPGIVNPKSAIILRLSARWEDIAKLIFFDAFAHRGFVFVFPPLLERETEAA